MSANNFEKLAPVHSRISIPQRYQTQPIISRLMSRYGLKINITAASFVSGSDSDGCFDLELLGNPEQLTNSLSYLQGLGVDLVQVAIANHIQLNQNSQPFPNPTNKLTSREFQSLTTQYPERFQQWISQGQANRLRLQVCILKTYYEKPVICELVSRYGLTVNITSALLTPDMQHDGWFDLDLWGRTGQLRSSLSYLEKLGLPIWPDWSSVSGDRHYSAEGTLS
ncbi:MAG: NIL domain-containing protein [Mojavia pulchra JT2-VF2]|jgi:hypothetical protein|uniref:NIL domain-containing protein n=1 Tax=Mojavia pulchra JT2-VF2 TaxID=287848 RepID=A0A951UHM3_9NOST|nr:NIL domain-containing protein [Mojavia pulchra JT2-VF2]